MYALHVCLRTTLCSKYLVLENKHIGNTTCVCLCLCLCLCACVLGQTDSETECAREREKESARARARERERGSERERGGERERTRERARDLRNDVPEGDGDAWEQAFSLYYQSSQRHRATRMLERIREVVAMWGHMTVW